MTSHPIRFHVLLLPNVPWDDLRARALHCEDLGFEAIALADHFVDWTNPRVPWFETWTSLAALAEATKTIRLSTAVTQIPLRNPAMLARQVLTLDHLSHGRVALGLGTGLTIDPSYAMAGLPNWDARERVSRFAEYIELVSLLLGQEETTWAGEWYRVDGAIMNPRPLQQPRPPLMVAALGPRMMELTARFADIWNSLSFKSDFAEQIAETAERCRLMDTLLERLDRDPATLERSYLMFDPTSRHHGGEIAYYRSPDQFRAMAEQVLALGITDIGLYYPIIPEQLPTFEEIATEVLPSLRKITPAR
jgi:alkanesulfonate monooxygenase SsuD/methylene tetrahydromethanopterin reductase-like flavin-dependent oxidoreductase (luciferase family)